MHVQVFGEHHEVDSIGQLQALLAYRHEGEYGAFWLAPQKHGCPGLGLFIADGEACLFFIPEEGDPGFHSLGPDPNNFVDQVGFVIDNYQFDLYPRAMVIPAAKGLAACEEFFRTGALPTAIRWLKA